MIFWHTSLDFDLELLRRDVERIRTESPGRFGRQWTMVFREGDEQDTAALTETRKLIGSGTYRESDFDHFHDGYRDTYLYEVYQEIRKERPIGRVRILDLHPYQCYSYHTDAEYRYHLAINTNPSCFFVLQKAGRKPDGTATVTPTEIDMSDLVEVYHVPADGHLYGMDLNRRHTAFNGGTTIRTHIVFNTISELNDRGL